MATLNEQLTELQTARDNIKTAIEGKGQTVTKDIRTYAEAINNIVSGGSTETTGVKQFSTTEEMQADATAIEGDIALVYSNNIGNPVEGDSNFTANFPNEVVVPTAVTATTGAAVQIGTSLWIRLRKTQCIIGSTSTLPVSSRLAVYTSADGITYTKTSGVSSTTIVRITTDNTNYLKFFETGELNFGGLYEFDGTEWINLNVGLSILAPGSLEVGVKAYGNNGVVTGNGAIINNLRASMVMRSIHGEENIEYSDATTDEILNGTTSDGYAKLSNIPEQLLYIDNLKTEHNTNILPIKYGTSSDRPLFDVLQKFKRTSDNTSYYTYVNEDGTHGFTLSGMVVTIDGTITITLPGTTTYRSLFYSTVVLQDSIFVFTHNQAGTGYITKISMIDGTYSSLTHSISGTTDTEFATMDHIYDNINDRIFVSLWLQDGTNSYGNIIYFDTDFTTVNNLTTLSISGAIDKDGDMAMTNRRELIIEMKGSVAKQTNGYLYDLDTLTRTTSYSYSWIESGNLLMSGSTTMDLSHNKIVWHIDNMLYSNLYGDPVALNIATSEYSEEFTDINGDTFPCWYAPEDDLVFSEDYKSDTITNSLLQSVSLYKRAIYDLTDTLVTIEDAKYITNGIICESYDKAYPTYVAPIPYFNGTAYKRLDVHFAMHQCGWWRMGTFADYDVLLIPATIVSDIKGVNGVRLDELYTTGYIPVYKQQN